jgi:hypothetical protein
LRPAREQPGCLNESDGHQVCEYTAATRRGAALERQPRTGCTARLRLWCHP